jgi:hypothetical protein
MKMLNIFLMCIIYLPYINSFLKFKFGNKINIKSNEIKHQITYKLPPNKQHIINKINGFYGLIGPDVNISSVNNLFDLFIGDGTIQGVFFDSGNVTVIKHFVRTDKLIYEEENGRIPNNNLKSSFAQTIQWTGLSYTNNNYCYYCYVIAYFKINLIVILLL